MQIVASLPKKNVYKLLLGHLLLVSTEVAELRLTFPVRVSFRAFA